MLINALIKFHKSPTDLNLTPQMEACLGFLPEETDCTHSKVRLIGRKVLRKCWATHAQFFLRSSQLDKSFLLLGGVRERKNNHKFSHISSSSLLIHKNATDFCVLILYTAVLSNLFIISNSFWEGPLLLLFF